ncbi:MAG: PAS domain-containing protein [Pseudomonadota bacterium]
MKHPQSRALYDYWDSLRQGRAAPYRSEVNPREISHLLENTFILEQIASGKARYRLAGTRLCSQFGMELRGMNALAMWHGECRRQVRTMISKVIEEPTVAHLTCTVETRSGYLFGAEFLYLPMRADNGEMTRILGCGHYMGSAHRDGELEPLLHWVDAISYHPIEITATEEAQDRLHPASDSPHLHDALSVLRGSGSHAGDPLRSTRTKHAGSMAGNKQAPIAAIGPARIRERHLIGIEGGQAGEPQDPEARSSFGRRRPYLRLIK